MYRPGWGEGMLETMLDEPRDTPWNKWGCGVAFPALLTLVGARVMFIQHFTFVGARLRRLQLTGSAAWWVGLAIVGLAAWFHFHFFWTHHSKLAPYAELGKVAGLLTFIGGLAWAIFSQFRFV